MMRRMIAAVAAVAVMGAAPAWAAGWGDKDEAKEGARVDEQTSEIEGDVLGTEERMDEVAGVRLVPSVIARDVQMTPSPWYLRGEGRNANANARVYTNREGAITGVTVRAWGLPNPDRINPRYNDYVVWLVDTETNQMKNIGVLESRNGGEAIFGFSPDRPLVGYDRIMISPEPTFATRGNLGAEQLTAELPQTAARPVEQPGMRDRMRMDR